MQMNIETDYAVRCILFLAQNDAYTPSGKIAEAMRIEKEQILRILKKLQAAGLVRSQRGQVGGFSLAKSTDQIMMRDIIEVMEDTIKINRCLENDGFCSRNGIPSCQVHQYYNGVQSILEQIFDNTSITDILSGNATAFSSLS